MSSIKLIIGLGNPGKKYAETRHNIGWMAAAELCRKYNNDPQLVNPLFYLASLKIEKSDVLVAFPITYMNESGKAAKWLLDKYEINPENTLIIVDEYNFPIGKVHLKKGGSDGGHNGVASVINELATTEFWRLRCGIGKNFPPGMLVDYVLSKFYKEELSLRNEMIKNAVTSLECIIQNGTARSMSEINSGKLFSGV